MSEPRPLFDVVIRVFGDDDTGAGIYDVEIIDTYHKRRDVIGRHEADSLDDAIEFAKRAVTAFMQATTADE